MSFQDQERRRLGEYALRTWGSRSHVIGYDVASETLHEAIREGALEYFRRHNIKWWTSPWDQRTSAMEARPTGHLNSSQLACVNHLEPARVDRAAAAQAVSSLALNLVPVHLDDGFVEYEWIGRDSYLGEVGPRTRGANITSIDAVMVGSRDGERILVVIEWKYLEEYGGRSVAMSKRGTDRVAIYRPLLERPDCPIAVADVRWLFYEPYYQLMRQTLLAWQLVEHQEFGATDWLHLQVVPLGNARLRGRGGAPRQLPGRGLAGGLALRLAATIALPTDHPHGADHRAGGGTRLGGVA